MTPHSSHFLRHTPQDRAALQSRIEQERASYRDATLRKDALAVMDHAGNLGVLLTNAGREQEAYPLLSAHLAAARETPNIEPSAWLVHALATAAQYVGEVDEANALFAEALQMAKAGDWQRLEHFVLHHWGRCLAEQRRFTEAHSCFKASLVLREALGDPLQESSRRALAALAALQNDA